MNRHDAGFLAVLIAAGAAVVGMVTLVDTVSPPWTPASGTPVYGYRVIATYPHDPTAFTQGLVYFDGYLYEGTGLYGRSSLRQQDLLTGEILRSVSLPSQYFGEGITILEGRVYQLTWQSRVGFVYDLNFTQLGSFDYTTEGWGLTHNGTHLIMSDGTDVLYIIGPETMEAVARLEVRDGGRAITWLNELEYLGGEIWANVWQTDLVVRISPENGSVLGWIDLSDLLGPSDIARPVDVLNGIAYDQEGGRILVTGKLWPKIFQIELGRRA